MKYKDEIYKNIREYCELNYERLNSEDFLIGDNPYNRRCHLNAVQKIKENKADGVWLCIAWDKDDKEPCVHFINMVKGKFQDNTWGWLYEWNIYYLIRQVKEKEYDYIWDVLMDTKRTIFRLNSNSFKNFIHRLNENII